MKRSLSAYLLSALLIPGFLYVSSAQPPTPAPPQEAPILILGATAHLGTGKAIENSAIAFENGKITLVGDASAIRVDRNKYGSIFDAQGKHIYPGFIATNSQLGLVEIGAVRATRDAAEVGSLNPNVRSIIAYNTDSDVTPTVRSNGVLMAQVVPTSGLLSGSSSVVQLDAWSWEDAVYRIDDGVHLNWPYRRMNRPGQRNRSGVDSYQKAIDALNDYFSEAAAYCKVSDPEQRNQRFEAMRSVFAAESNLYIHVNDARGIQEAVLFAEKMEVKPVLVGANDAWMLVDFLKDHNVPVILNITQRTPGSSDADIDQPYKNPGILNENQILFCIAGESTWQQRNLPFQAGQAAGYGLDYESAVAAITLNAAKILGVSDRCGSIEQGKDATLFICEGDALDMRTCRVTAAFIQGRQIDLDNKHKALQRRFNKKP